MKTTCEKVMKCFLCSLYRSGYVKTILSNIVTIKFTVEVHKGKQPVYGNVIMSMHGGTFLYISQTHTVSTFSIQ